MSARWPPDPIELREDHASQIAAFTKTGCEFDTLTTTLVRRRIFEDPDPQVALGVFDAGLEAVGVGVVRGTSGFVKVLAVHPRLRRRKLGTMLLEHIESFCRQHGARTVEVGTSAPRYVSPGVDVRTTDAVCFYPARGYAPAGEAVNLGVSLRELPEPELEVVPAYAGPLDAVRAWVREEHPHWIPALDMAAARGECVVCGAEGFACYEIESGWFGPIATRRDARGKGIGASLLIGALRAMQQAGLERAEIVWADATPFYSKVAGARISRVFWWYRKELD